MARNMQILPKMKVPAAFWYRIITKLRGENDVRPSKRHRNFIFITKKADFHIRHLLLRFKHNSCKKYSMETNAGLKCISF